MKRHYIGIDDFEPVYEHGSMVGVEIILNGTFHFFPCDEFEILGVDAETFRKYAHDEAWNFAKTIQDMTFGERKECFNETAFSAIIKLGYEKAKKTYDDWKKKKKPVKEMTLEEISQALGYEVKIINKEEK